MMGALSILFPYYLCMLLLTSSYINALEKHWIRSNSWNDPSNWEPPRLPCPSDHIVLKQDVIYIESNITIKSELALPIDGEILLGSASSIVFRETPERSKRSTSTCSRFGVDVNFIGQQHKNWLNPLNWMIYTNGIKDDYLTKGAPFIERIPCITDRISFPASNAFEIQVPKDVTIREMVVNQKVVTDNNVLQSYLNSPEGKAIFKFQTANPSLKIDSTVADSCQYSWCKCRDKSLIKSICQSFKCPQVKLCLNEVKPLNDCCDHCGSVVNFDYGHPFNFNACWQELRARVASNNNFAGVRLYMYPIESDNAKVQLLFSEDNDGTNAATAAKYVERILNSIESCGENLRIGNKIVTNEKRKHDKPSNKGTTALAVILTILALALIAFAVYYYKFRRTPSTIKRRRFENDDDFTQFPGVEDVDTDFSSPVVSGGTTQFANPLYELQNLEDNDNGVKNDDLPSPEFAIPIDYFNHHEKSVEPLSTEPRYVERPLFSEGLTNPSYDLDEKFDPDDNEGDIGNINPLYEEVMKDSEKMSPVAVEADLDLTDEADPIGMKLELKVSDLSDSEGNGQLEFQLPECHDPPSQVSELPISEYEELKAPELHVPGFQIPDQFLESQYPDDGSVNVNSLYDETLYSTVQK